MLTVLQKGAPPPGKQWRTIGGKHVLVNIETMQMLPFFRVPASAYNHDIPPDSELGQFKTIEDAEAWASARYRHIRFDFTNAHIDAINPTLQEFHEIAQEWPEVAAMIRYVGTHQGMDAPYPDKTNFAPGVMAHCAWNNAYIGLNPAYYGNPDLFREACEATERDKWHPDGCYTVESIISHEMGHAVLNWLQSQRATSPGGVYRPDLTVANMAFEALDALEPYRHALSTYAHTHADEAWAEGFAQNRAPIRWRDEYTVKQDQFLTWLRRGPMTPSTGTHYTEADPRAREDSDAWIEDLRNILNN